MTFDQFILQNYQAAVSVTDLKPFLGERVFFNVLDAPAAPAGGSRQAVPGSTITIPFTPTPMGAVVIFYTTATDKRLGKPFAGMLLAEAIEIVGTMADVKGLLLQSSKEPALMVGKS